MPRILRVYTRVHMYFYAYSIKIIKNIYKNSLFSGWVDGYSGSSTTPTRAQLFPTDETTLREYKNPSCAWPKGGRNLEILYSVGIPIQVWIPVPPALSQIYTGNPCFLEMFIHLYAISSAQVLKVS